MIVTSNLSGNHGENVQELLCNNFFDLLFISPYLTDNFGTLFKDADFSSVKSITLVTTLKKNDQDQITKPKSLKSFYKLVKAKCPEAKVKIHIDNSLHGKIYIFKKNDSQKAIVTSANLTYSGFYKNHEWGVLIDDSEAIAQLENEVLECIDYPDITESLVDRLLMYSEQYENLMKRENPDWNKDMNLKSDVLEQVYNQGANNNDNPRYWLKPIGVSDDPVLKKDQEDFSDLHQNLDFSTKGVGAIRAGDIVITTAVGCGCLLSYFQITGSPKEATHEEKQQSPWKERWPWHIEGRNLSTDYGSHWWEYDLDRKLLLEAFIEQYPDEIVTRAGARSLGTLNFGSDKVEITKVFADYLISNINNV